METITNFISNSITNTDNTITSILENRYFYITIVVITLLYGSLAQSRLTHTLLSLLDSPLSRLTAIGFIYYIATKNVPLAILMLTATVMSLNTQNRQRFNIMLISLFRGKIDRPKMMQDENKKELKKIRKQIKKLLERAKKIGIKKVPLSVKNMAKKAKQITKEIGEKTPKYIKNILDNKKITSILDNLVLNKKMSKTDSEKLKSINSEVLADFIKSSESSVIETKIIKPKITGLKTEKFSGLNF